LLRTAWFLTSKALVTKRIGQNVNLAHFGKCYICSLTKKNRMSRNNSCDHAVNVRVLRRRDFADLVNNYYSIYDEVKRNPWVGIDLFSEKPSLKDERKWFRDTLKQIAAKTELVLVAEVNGKVVGITDVRNKTPQQEQRHVGVVGILVLEGYRSMGVGTALLTELIKKAKTEGKYETLVLSVFGNNKHAQSLYRKMGFTQYGVLPNGIKRFEQYTDEICMYRKL